MATPKRLAEAVELSADQEALAQRVFENLRVTMDEEVLAMARLMASQPDDELLGRGEFALRDRLQRVGAKVLETAVNERAKKGVLRC
jgi:predicted GNAT family N-acyltransferase